MEVAGECWAVGRLAGERKAEAAGVGGEGVVEQEEGAADVRCAIHQVDLRAPLGQVVGGGHSSQASADDENAWFGHWALVIGNTASIIAST